MGRVVGYASNLKKIVLLGAMLLVAISGFAQQEVDPDHFEGTPMVTVPKHVTKSRKQSASKPAATAVSKQPVRQAKASKNTGAPKVVTVSAH